jgi:uncharacterized protein (TIGR02145 family)
LILDEDGNIIYAAPEEGSLQAQNVDDPLPIEFVISLDEILDLEVEVLSTENLGLEDFGLVGFDLSLVDLFRFYINVSEKGNLETLLSAELVVTSDSYSFHQELEPIASNSIVIKDGFSTYDISVSLDGYLDYAITLSREELIQYESTPLTIELETASWTPGQDYTDARDGVVYKTVQIGDQVWMAENLRATSLTDGTPIENIIEQDDWIVSDGAAYSWHSNDENTYGEYGILYNWYAVETEMLCPTSWHVASESEWSILIEYVGGSEVAGGMLKESGNDHWITPNTAATNEFGFTSLPGGSRQDYATLAEFVASGKFGYWWTSTESSETEAKNFGMSYNISRVDNFSYGKGNGLSVRCIKN